MQTFLKQIVKSTIGKALTSDMMTAWTGKVVIVIS